MSNQPSKRLSRRDSLKLLGAAAGASVLANLPSKWSTPELAKGVLPAHAQTSPAGPTAPTLPTVLTVSVDSNTGNPLATLHGDLTSDGGSPVSDRGFYWANHNNPTVADNIVSLGAGPSGPFSTIVIHSASSPFDHWFRAFATNAVGTAVGAVLGYATGICLVEGTLLTLADRSVKKIEDIQYSDTLCVWNFDEGRFDVARPLWIKQAEVTDRYNLLEFSDGSTLRTVNQHRIFNKQMGRFTHPMTEDTPLGTTTFNVHGEEVMLVNKRVVQEQVRFYNVITDRHINLFADGLLTSCRYNNIYPIIDMKFVKDERVPIPQERYGVDERYYDGLRLAEQPIPVADTIAYVKRLEAYKVDQQAAMSTSIGSRAVPISVSMLAQVDAELVET